METSDNEDGFMTEASKNNDNASPSADGHSVANIETSQPESDVNFSQLESEEPFSQQFGRADQPNKLGNIIVMSPADFTQVEEEPERRRSSRKEEASMGAFRSGQERIQLATGADSSPAADSVDEATPADEKSTKKVAEWKPATEAKEAEEEIDHKAVADGGGSPASDSQDAEVVAKIRRRKSMFLSNDILKKESFEPFKIDIPLRKKVNKSTKKKLWREIERRKPFITQNVKEHISTYAKPPFITWGCKNCEFPYESEA